MFKFNTTHTPLPKPEKKKQLLCLHLRMVELVLARYNENISWVSSLPASVNVMVYDKGNRSSDAACLLPNVGRESHTFLHHIVDRYDRLAEWTVFSQAGEPSAGYAGHRAGGGHLPRGVSFSEYLVPRRQPFFVATAIFRLQNAWNFSSSQRDSYDAFDGPASRDDKMQCPSVDRWGPFWSMGWFQQMVQDRARAQRGVAFRSFWTELVGEVDRPIIATAFPQGARFAVAREHIRRRPRAYYEALLRSLESNRDPFSGYFMEWAWPAVLGAAQCELPPLDAPSVSFDEARAMRHLSVQATPSPTASPLPRSDDGPKPAAAQPPPAAPPPGNEPSPSPPATGAGIEVLPLVLMITAASVLVLVTACVWMIRRRSHPTHQPVPTHTMALVKPGPRMQTITENI